jgi:hypothetical protein
MSIHSGTDSHDDGVELFAPLEFNAAVALIIDTFGARIIGTGQQGRHSSAHIASGDFQCWAACGCRWTGPRRASGGAERDYGAAKRDLLEHLR